MQRLGFYDPTHLAVTPERLRLGVVGAEQFDRTPESLGKHQERKRLPIEEKESFRWLEGHRLASGLAGEHPGTRVVSVADCEAGIYDIFMEVDKLAAPADFVIRAKEDRCTPERDPDSGPAVYRKVRDQASASAARIQKTIALPQTPKREARAAEPGGRAIQATVKPPHARSPLPTVTYNVALVEEVDGPNDGTDVSWLLITTLPIDSTDGIQRVIDYYVARWSIEVCFRVLETGCRLEEIRLETTRRVKNCLAFYKIIAWRVMRLNRQCPTLTCTAAFEWKSGWKVTKKEAPNTTTNALRVRAASGPAGRRQQPSP